MALEHPYFPNLGVIDIDLKICFAHQPFGPDYTISGWVNYDDGLMLTLKELPGEFAPHLFVRGGI